MIKKYIFRDKIKKETFWAFAAKFISSVSGLFMIIFIPRFWGVDIYGYFSLIIAYIVILEIFFGNSINQAIKKDISEHKFSEKGKEILVNGLKIKLILFFIGTLLTILFLDIVKVQILNSYFIFFISLLFLMNFWGLVVSFFEASHKLFFELIMYILEYSITIFMLLFFFFSEQLNLESLIISFIGGYFISFLFGLIILFKKLRVDFSLFKLKLDPLIAKKLLNRTFFLTLVTVSFVLLTRIDIIMLSYLTSINNVGFYNIAVEMTKNATIISVAIILGVVPLFVNKNKKDLFKKTFKKLFLVNLIIFIGFFVLSDLIVDLLYGPNFEKVSFLIKILGIYPLLLSLQSFTSEILILKDRVRVLFLNGLLAVILNIFLNFLLITYLGVYGAAFATLISYSFWFLLNFKSLIKII